MTLGDRVSKTLSWFDSGYGYAHRAVELVERCAALEAARDDVRVGINGFGRIGRSVFRILSDRAGRRGRGRSTTSSTTITSPTS